MQLSNQVLLEIKMSRMSEETPEAMVQFLASLTDLKHSLVPGWKIGIPISLEIVAINQTIHFLLSVPETYQSFIESQLTANYPKVFLVSTIDHIPQIVNAEATLAVGQMKLTHGPFYPLRTYDSFKDVDSLSSLLGLLSKMQSDDAIAIQFLLVPISTSWQRKGEHSAASKATDATGKEQTNPYGKVIMQKIAVDGFKTGIRIAVNTHEKERSNLILRHVANSFATFNNPTGNALILRKPYLWQRARLIEAMKDRSRRFMPQQILNLHELATVYHFPTTKLATIQNISWHKTILSEPPESLPINDVEDTSINFFAQTEFKNHATKFGIKEVDRRRHMYIIGKTGTGKSTLVANLAINDMRKRKGLCVVDPHGDLCETLLEYVPANRINDVVYLDPSDLTHTFFLNPLEVADKQQMELIVSGIVAIFHKLYGNSWGPRLEYILRNTLLTLAQIPNATMLMIPELLTNDSFRAKILQQVDDPVLKNYWEGEFANLHPRLRTEAISPILNKVGQFISSRFVRNILSSPTSTIDLEKLMNEEKIILVNLSQGKLGEDNSALLGAMIISKIQLAAMNRVNIAEKDRRDFYLYVDEFQNFATTSFIKILSEARKYRLNLILANQYIAQIPEDVRNAIFGNAGTMLSFLIGAQDSVTMSKEFKERFKEEDLLALGKYQAIIKQTIDGMTQSPFLCNTLPLPHAANQNRAKVIEQSRRRYMRPIKE